MIVLKKNNLLIFSIIFTVYYVSWTMQSHLLLNGDVSWLSFAAKKILQGGQYGTDFLETNPPLIIYLYIPLLWIQKYFDLNEITSLLIYTYVLTSVSLFAIYILLNNVILKDNYPIKILTITVLSILFLVIPVSEFGQREHLAVIFCTPYYFLLAARLKSQQISIYSEITIGILAGIGFALKPYFYFPFFLAELVYIYYKRDWFSFRRIEFYLISIIGCLYLTIILLYNFNYISIIIPLIAHSYYPKYQLSLKYLLFNEQSIYGYLLILFYFMFHKQISYKPLITILFAAFFAFWLVFILQKMGWTYHALPFYTYVILIYFLLYIQLVFKIELSRMDYLKIIFFNILVFFYYFIHISYITLNAYYFPHMYFILFFFIFSLFFIFYRRVNLSATILIFLMINFVNIIFYYYLRMTIFNHYLIHLSVFMWFLCLALWMPEKKIRHVFLAAMGILIFSFPFYKAAYMLNYSQYYNKLYRHMIDDMRIFSNNKVYFFSPSSELIFPLIDYAKLDYSSRFWSMIWLPTMKDPLIEDNLIFYQLHKDELDFYIKCIVNDLRSNKPDTILVDIRTKGYFFNIPMNYIALFSENESFKNQWKEYKFLKTLNYPPLYKFAVFVKK